MTTRPYSPLPRCPRCGSYHVSLAMRPGVVLQEDDAPFINATSKRCSNCAHEWDRTAHRGVSVQPAQPPVPKEGFWDRIFRRFFPHLF